MTTDISFQNTTTVTLSYTDSSNSGKATAADYDYGDGFGNPTTHIAFMATFLLIGCLGLIGNTFVIAVLVCFTKPYEKVISIQSSFFTI
jgi:hypothetical protein